MPLCADRMLKSLLTNPREGAIEGAEEARHVLQLFEDVQEGICTCLLHEVLSSVAVSPLDNIMGLHVCDEGANLSLGGVASKHVSVSAALVWKAFCGWQPLSLI